VLGSERPPINCQIWSDQAVFGQFAYQWPWQAVCGQAGALLAISHDCGVSLQVWVTSSVVWVV